jgi:hypothetical protein
MNLALDPIPVFGRLPEVHLVLLVPLAFKILVEIFRHPGSFPIGSIERTLTPRQNSVSPQPLLL